MILPSVRELGGIAQQVENDLPDLILVGVDDGQAFIHLFFEHHAGSEQRLGGVGAQIDQGADPEIGGQHIHAAGFDLGDVQHGVDQVEQVLGADQDLVQVLGLLLGQHAFGFAADDAGEADDGVERRAQLVAHVGQEGALGLVGLFGGSALAFLSSSSACLRSVISRMVSMAPTMFPLASCRGRPRQYR